MAAYLDTPYQLFEGEEEKAIEIVEVEPGQVQDGKLRMWLEEEGLSFLAKEFMCLKYSDLQTITDDEVNILCTNLNTSQKLRTRNAIHFLREKYSIKTHAPIQKPVKYDNVFKIILVGDCSVGKTSILNRFRKDYFEPSYNPTIGLIFKTQLVKMPNKTAKLEIHDTGGGSHEYGTISKAFFRGAHAALIIYDVSNQESFDHVASWMNKLDVCVDAKTWKMLIGNKTDLENRTITKHQGQELASHYGVEFVECSAKQEKMLVQFLQLYLKLCCKYGMNLNRYLFPKISVIVVWFYKLC
eukprot:14795_1